MTELISSQKQCSIDGCERPHYGRGWCSMHWRRWRSHGDPLFVKLKLPPRGELLSFFNEQIARSTPDDCLIWKYGKNISTGYGRIRVDGKLWLVHRYSLYLHTGVNPIDRYACHGPCNNSACFNPYHLSWGTSQSNMEDRKRDGTDNRGKRHGMSKLTECSVMKIRADSRPQSQIAEAYQLDQSTVSNIKTRKTWSWLN